ncbi:MAG: AMP-binding protein, partial [Alphaproteobacteria bacterium]|nr:AMP-binding protein [Alphaproteobacteria bacterium]
MPGAPLAALVRREQISHATLSPTALAALEPQLVPSLNTIVVAGEACSADLAAQWTAQGCGRRLINAYGPTETTICATMGEVQPGDDGAPPIGRPVQNMTVHVLDPWLQPQPVGIPGELYIGGPGLARGYCGRAGLTAERFIANPFGPPGSRLYRTGDVARWRHDGRLDYVGRVDHQVKLRGFRIELGEIEAALCTHRAIREAVVVVGAGQRTELVAHVVLRDAVTEMDLRQALRTMLPEYMVPAQIVFHERLALTPAGKIDRAALALSKARAEQVSRAPEGEDEEAIAAIWCRVLNRTRVGAEDSFFDIGGHSLLAVEAVARLSQHFGMAVPVSAMFRAPTIAELARDLQTRRGEPAAAELAPPLVPLRNGRDETLFLIHPVSGDIACYRHIIRAWSGQTALVGLRAPVLDGGPDVSSSIVALARTYCRAIRAHAGWGLIHLAGWSFGGLVAVELARQLAADGTRIGRLCILDAAAVPEPPPELSDSDILEALRRGVASTPLSGEALRADALHLAAVRAHLTAAQGYVPPVLDGPASLLVGADRTADMISDALGWRPYLKAVEVTALPLRHAEMMSEDAAPAIASWLAAQIKRSRFDERGGVP